MNDTDTIYVHFVNVLLFVCLCAIPPGIGMKNQ